MGVAEMQLWNKDNFLPHIDWYEEKFSKKASNNFVVIRPMTIHFTWLESSMPIFDCIWVCPSPAVQLYKGLMSQICASNSTFILTSILFQVTKESISDWVDVSAKLEIGYALSRRQQQQNWAVALRRSAAAEKKKKNAFWLFVSTSSKN